MNQTPSPALVRIAVNGLVRASEALGHEMRRKDARQCVLQWIADETFDAELARLERLMKQPPVPLANRAKHTSGGTR